MVKIVQVFILGIIFLIIAYGIRALSKTKINYEGTTYATIDRVIHEDGGYVRYYVSFQLNGNKILAQTDYYSWKTKSLNPGDEVKIGYRFVESYFSKDKIPLAVIFDERIIPVSSLMSNTYKFPMIAGILLVAIALVMFVRLIV